MTQLLENINSALNELENYRKINRLSIDEWSTKTTEKVFFIMKDFIINDREINTRILRAMKDVYVVSYRNFNGTELHRLITNIDKELLSLYKDYENLTPLGMDFGKGNPI